ncbi:OmpA family protein [uncultured Roseicyclus sp.]|jgi:outer membrane protein OmpA-like peptidoglycan-associated protein|uniref:OmpA family protein n=1 Tax=uncultured Roseicyclus sp. TaxID=543072 RepID=UPI0026221629|nr:OmpA family protein [uncultured Roseicyclus sp.]
MSNYRLIGAGVLAASFALGGCENIDGTSNQPATGAIIGGLTGAAAGQIIGGDTQSTVIGGAIGAAIGGAIGAQMETQERELRRSLAGTGVAVTNTGQDIRVILPESVTFRTDSSTVDPSFRPALRAVSESLRQHPNSTVLVVGHTDTVGTAAYNKQLSEERAMAVASELVAFGTSASRIRVLGRGFEEPIATNATVAGRAQNRRVEIIITPNR